MKTNTVILIILLALCSSLFAADPWGTPQILTTSMSVMAQVSINGTPAAAEDLLLAFVSVGDTPILRGKATVRIIDGVAGCLLQVYTESDDETIAFQVWDESSQTAYSVTQTLSAEVNGFVGSYPDSLYQINAELAMQQAADPIFDPEAGHYLIAQELTISCATPGASIYYTTDGSEPDAGSALYTQPLTISTNTQVKAKAHMVNWTPSFTASAYYTIGDLVADPWPQPQILSGSMTVMAQVSINDAPAEDGDILAAFVTVAGIEQLRGKTPVQVISGVAGCILQIFSENSGEVISFKIWDYDIQQSFTDSNTLISQVNATVGSYPDNLYQINAGGTTLQVAPPMFNPPEGTYSTAQVIMLSSATPAATIRYTTNGDEPSETSPAFSAPISIPLNSTLIIKAKAYKTGWNPSVMISGMYNITGTVAAPVFTPPAGVYTTAQNVSLSCVTPNAQIRYTTDGAEPTASSTLYSTPLLISSTKTLKAKAFLPGWAASATSVALYTITGIVAIPIFTPPAGTYTTSRNVSLSCATPGAQIRYTTNGAEPTTNSTLYSTPIIISSTTTLKAKAFLSNWTPSATATALYTITGTVATPVFTPAAGTYNTAQNVSMSCVTPNAQIRYTTTGAEPTVSSELYTTPVPISSTTTLKAKAFLNEWTPSATAVGLYTITGTVATPEFSPEAGEYEVAIDVIISCATADAHIRYTMDGTEPGTTSTLYTAAIHLVTDTTIKAKAFLATWQASTTATAVYEVTVGTPDGPQTPVVAGIQELYPNPFAADLTLKLGTCELPQDYHLKIYNLKGARVYQTKGNAKGNFELIWDGRDQNGARLAPGVYLISFVTGKQQSSRKVVLQ
ncbi:MAG: chitobiase/beta-hexosaminidase C-terminal domain-containing protein [Candidatus Cloacimonetes bacterium]|nr:chitobiase/beta-hexosaminidase C-terminal domain-containing protein [Candidatus Cloacimonadota bacterium]MDY0230004.1 chitobiase/beta-hexosaminidase C-terminal domain-containing protein [Candidatus Cloacimonadaceae bacterium]